MFCPLSLRANSSNVVQTLLMCFSTQTNTNYRLVVQSQLITQNLSNRAGSLLRASQNTTTANHSLSQGQTVGPAGIISIFQK